MFPTGTIMPVVETATAGLIATSVDLGTTSAEDVVTPKGVPTTTEDPTILLYPPGLNSSKFLIQVYNLHQVQVDYKSLLYYVKQLQGL